MKLDRGQTKTLNYTNGKAIVSRKRIDNHGDGRVYLITLFKKSESLAILKINSSSLVKGMDMVETIIENGFNGYVSVNNPDLIKTILI